MRLFIFCIITSFAFNIALADCKFPTKPAFADEPFVGSICDNHQDTRNYNKEKCKREQRKLAEYNAEIEKTIICLRKSRKR